VATRNSYRRWKNHALKTGTIILVTTGVGAVSIDDVLITNITPVELCRRVLAETPNGIIC